MGACHAGQHLEAASQAVVEQLGMNFLEHLIEGSDADLEVTATVPKEGRNWAATATFCAIEIRYVEPVYPFYR